MTTRCPHCNRTVQVVDGRLVAHKKTLGGSIKRLHRVMRRLPFGRCPGSDTAL